MYQGMQLKEGTQRKMKRKNHKEKHGKIVSLKPKEDRFFFPTESMSKSAIDIETK